jgi:leucyl/phenylalanyl-tRNA---protein transferase
MNCSSTHNMRMHFPSPRGAPHDVIAIGGDLEVPTLLEAYRKGIFPWPIDDYPLTWFSPHRRGVLFFEELRISRSLAKVRRKSGLELTIDRAFEDVVERCASVSRKGETGTWITPGIQEAYLRLHREGHAHSVEAWSGGRLAGGIYGVDAGGVFSGESMFHLEPNASKIALLHLIDHLRDRGAAWLDVQILTPHIEQMGGRQVGRRRFLDLLREGLDRGARLF